MPTLEKRDALFALDDLVHSVDVVRRLARTDKKEWRKRDIVALREARETYFRAMEKLKTMTLAIAQPSVRHRTDEDMSEEQIIELQEEKEALKEELASKNARLKCLLATSRGILDMMERWDRWEIPPEDHLKRRLDDDRRLRAASDISSVDME